MTEPRLRRGSPVRKRKGYPFPGWVVARFATRSGLVRLAVEHATEVGMLHVFNEEQLEPRETSDSFNLTSTPGRSAQCD